MPFRIPALALQCPTPYFEQSHSHSRSHLRQFDTLISRSYEDMVSYFDTILNVLECNNSVADLLVGSSSLAGWEKVLEYLNHSLAKRTVKVFKDEVRV